MESIKSNLPLLLSKATLWTAEVEAYVVQYGQPLTEQQVRDASLVGVKSPHKIYVLELETFPLPNDDWLQQAALKLDFLGENTTGLTLGYAILIKKGALSRRLLSHECRHVYQYEQAGSIANFLESYFNSVLAVGYFDSFYERDARQHELPV